ncbi:glutathione S-transferase [Peteryoungia desertarenae]|uniref:Glutathione S-transferase n=1 Tax=Peteryoungia desertarenae TaxID=1813451 RepID=A0ABX6QQY9_9HYPH|nr:glutathione S-transferase [Peteryoungia desertarenae]QLF70918.1 glutathione S-transferase [Peteryoungia desertarenae]
MITVHYLDNSRAHRILWLLEELGQDYEVKLYHRGRDYRGPESLKAVHPLGKSPVIEEEGRVIAESGAIMEYLIERHEGGWLHPEQGSDNHLRYRYWMHYAEGSAMPLLVMKLIFSRIPGEVPFFIRPIARLISEGVGKSFIDPQLADHVALWKAELEGDGWFAGGAFSAADIAMSFPVEAGLTRIARGVDVTVLRSWMERIRARPAYQRALARGGDYGYSKN